MVEGRYSRIGRFAGLRDTLARWQAVSAAVVGLGGLGGGLVLQLARIGAKRLVLVDHDVVKEENLGHQALFTEQQAATAVPKVDAAADAVRSVNSGVETVRRQVELDRNNIATLLDGVQLIFDGLDNFPGRLLLNDYALRTGTPYFFAGVVRGEVTARAVVPGITGCLRCLLPNLPDPADVPSWAAEGLFPPLLGVANALQLDAATRVLAGKFTREDDVLYALNTNDWRLRQVPLDGPNLKCPACGQGRYDFLEGTAGA